MLRPLHLRYSEFEVPWELRSLGEPYAKAVGQEAVRSLVRVAARYSSERSLQAVILETQMHPEHVDLRRQMGRGKGLGRRKLQ